MVVTVRHPIARTLAQHVVIGLGMVVFLSSGCSPQSGSRAADRSADASGSGAPAASDTDRYDLAWQFATSIQNDEKDLALFQHRVAQGLLEAGRVEEALERAKAIKDWRKADFFAEATTWLARAGRVGEAKDLIREAEAMWYDLRGTRRDQVRMRLAAAMVELGDDEEIQRIRDLYVFNERYSGQMGAYAALRMALRGRPNDAVSELDNLPDAQHPDVAEWQARGYRMVADSGAMKTVDRDQLLERAWQASGNLFSSALGFSTKMLIVDSMNHSEDREKMTALLARYTDELMPSGVVGHVKAPLLAKAAIRWGALNHGARVDEIVAMTNELIEKDMLPSERPPVHALVGEAYAALGKPEEAQSAYLRALDRAAELGSQRMRCRVGTDISLSLARSGFADDAVSAKLADLLASVRPAGG